MAERLSPRALATKGALPSCLARCRSISQAQQFSPTFSHVYAALVSVINSKFPQIGELIIRRLIIHDKHGLTRNAFNAKINIYRATGEPILLGIEDRNLLGDELASSRSVEIPRLTPHHAPCAMGARTHRADHSRLSYPGW